MRMYADIGNYIYFPFQLIIELSKVFIYNCYVLDVYIEIPILMKYKICRF